MAGRWRRLVRLTLQHIPSIGPTAAAVYLSFRLETGVECEQAQVSVSAVARNAGLSLTSTREGIDILEAAGFISKLTDGVGRTLPTWAFMDPPEMRIPRVERRPRATRLTPVETHDPADVVEPEPAPEPPAQKAKREKPEMPAEAVRLADLLGELIRKVDPKVKTMPGWAADIEKLHRIDEREWDEIEKVMRWARAEPFWQGYILSGGALRKKFPTLLSQMNSRGRGGSRSFSSERTGAYNDL